MLASPLQRARETCDLAGLGAHAVVDDDLHEWDYGDYEGLTTDGDPRDRRRIGTSVDGGVPDGETVDAGRGARADRVIARVDCRSAGDVALVAHGHILRVLGARWVGLPAVDGEAARARHRDALGARVRARERGCSSAGTC